VSLDELAKHLNGLRRYLHWLIAIPKHLLSKIEAKSIELP
jgi:hypothetical protein